MNNLSDRLAAGVAFQSLKPCPFCGGRARFWIVSHGRDVYGVVGCRAVRCHAQPYIKGKSSVQTKTLARRWNRRTGQ